MREDSLNGKKNMRKRIRGIHMHPIILMRCGVSHVG